MYGLLWLILPPVVGAGFEFLLGRWWRYAGLAALTGTIGGLLALVAQLVWAVSRTATIPSASFQPDWLGLVLAFLLLGLGIVGIAFDRWHFARMAQAPTPSPTLSADGGADRQWRSLLFGCEGLFIAAGVWAAFTDQLIMLYVAVEATTLASALPVAFHRRESSWEAAYKYLLLNTAGLTLGLLGLVLLYAGAVPTLGAGALRLSMLRQGLTLPPQLAVLAGGLLVVGFGTKAALVPLHTWLPDAYQETPGGFQALFAGAGTKVALVALARVLPPLVATAPVLRTALLLVAGVTMLVGVGLTFVQDDLRRLLGYSSISQMGYILMAIAVGGAAGNFAAAFHMVSHGLLKALLFLCAAALYKTGGTVSLAELAGRRHSHGLAILFFMGALGLGGVPPLPAFWSKFAVVMATAATGHPWAAGVAVLTSLLTLTTLVRTGSRIFLQPADDSAHMEV